MIWFIVVLVGPYTIFTRTPLSEVISDQVLLINFFQRILGLIAFSLIFSQVILGLFMGKLTQKLGSWIYKFHITEGLFTYLFIFGHPLMFVLLNYKLKGTIDPFYVYTDICLICKPLFEYFYTFGRVAFWFLTIGVTAAYFRTHPWLRVHWLKFHILNLFAFYLIALHSYVVGSDVKSTPFIWFYWFAISVVTGGLVYKGLSPLFLKLRKEKNSGEKTLNLQKQD